ncbi:exodeoxyribonuclease V subunit alpha [Marinicella meishanensis]|uniref:exodeoxyribonuclease V subunit alpha n=1 Tax=Marinicella meishanensis TaxID=2873263 RepID=UPI001CBDD471|nr:exodeoxyribonuclease V subunit alpha [Marinicella sp. NBU2979]
MKISPTVAYLQQSFPGHDLDWSWLQDQLLLDLAHIQLLRDGFREWSMTDERLLLVLLYLVDAVNRGSLCLQLSDRRLKNATQHHQLGDLGPHLATLAWADMTLWGHEILWWQGDLLYFKRHHHLQQALQHDLSQLLAQPNHPPADAIAIKTAIQSVVRGLPYELEPQQLQALLTAVLQPFSIISGGPGTGKTTIVLSLLRVLHRLGLAVEDMALAAPTGRAANRVTESIRAGLSVGVGATDRQHDPGDDELAALEATTIHRLLGAHPLRAQNRYHANNKLPQRLLVVDEVSMVDLALMQQLIAAVDPGTRLVLLGDQFQLPSVQNGAVLADLMPPLGHDALNSAEFVAELRSMWPTGVAELPAVATTQAPQLLTDRVTILQTSKRCEPHIAALSEQVKNGAVSVFWQAVSATNADAVLTGKSAHGALWLDALKTPWEPLPLAWFERHFLRPSGGRRSYRQLLQHLHGQQTPDQTVFNACLAELFALLNTQRILTLTHQGPTGTQRINAAVAGWLQQRLGVTGTTDCFHGAVIMVLRNDPALGLYNGDIGLVLERQPQQFVVAFATESGFVMHSVHLIPAYQLAFAMTVHKSQGSEYDHVLMPLTEQLDNPLLTREIIYTGMTRAKQSVCLYGSQAALSQSIANKTTRHSGLSFWYNQAKNED